MRTTTKKSSDFKTRVKKVSCYANSAQERKIKVEVFNSLIGDTENQNEFDSYVKAVVYAKRIKKSCNNNCYIFILIPMNDGYSDYYRREDWTNGKHDRWLDEDIY